MVRLASILSVLCLACGMQSSQILTWLVEGDCSSGERVVEAEPACPMSGSDCCATSCCCEVTPEPTPSEPEPSMLVVETHRIDWVPRESKVQWAAASELPRDDFVPVLRRAKPTTASARRAQLAIWQT